MKMLTPVLAVLIIAGCQTPRQERSDEEIAEAVARRVEASLKEQLSRELRELVEKKLVVEPGGALPFRVERVERKLERPVERHLERPLERHQGKARPVEPARKPGFLGVRPEDTDHGVRVSEVIKNSAAEKVGLQKGDIIRSVNGHPVGNTAALMAIIQKLGEGAAVELTICRDGKELTAKTALGGCPREFELRKGCGGGCEEGCGKEPD